MKHTISVFGLGFVGLATSLAFAEKRHLVYGIDADRRRSESIRSGVVPFQEPGLDEALKRHNNQSFIVSDDIESAVGDSDYVFICVGTPSSEDGHADLRYVYDVIDSISGVLNDGKQRVVVLKSTVPPTTTSEKVFPYMIDKGFIHGEHFLLANNPEFLREGKVWEDVMNPDRIICGVSHEAAADKLKELYRDFDAPFFAVSWNTGEFVKYLSNAMLATMISFSNEMLQIADAIGDIQVKEAFKMLHLDRRWGNGNMSSYVYPGPGYGGYCLPKDARALQAFSLTRGMNPGILHHVIQTNDMMPQYMVDKIIAAAKPSDRIGILGLSFKPGSDDVRYSSSARVIQLLKEAGCERIMAYDPVAASNFKQEYDFDGIEYCEELSVILEEADVLVLVTAWEEFKQIESMKLDKKIIDCRFFLNLTES